MGLGTVQCVKASALEAAEAMEEEGRHSERDALGFGKPDTTEHSGGEYGYSC